MPLFPKSGWCCLIHFVNGRIVDKDSGMEVKCLKMVSKKHEIWSIQLVKTFKETEENREDSWHPKYQSSEYQVSFYQIFEVSWENPKVVIFCKMFSSTFPLSDPNHLGITNKANMIKKREQMRHQTVLKAAMKSRQGGESESRYLLST